MLRYFAFSVFITVAAILIALFGLGIGAALTTIVLIAIEMAFSFDNAIVNAKILSRLSYFWQQLFLTVGMVVAILGMRFRLSYPYRYGYGWSVMGPGDRRGPASPARVRRAPGRGPRRHRRFRRQFPVDAQPVLLL
jgi:hypothetical protein